MKKSIYVIISTFIFALFLATVVYAEEPTASYASRDGILEISGKIGEVSGRAVFVFITKNETDKIDLSASDTAADTVYTSDNGMINLSVKLPEFSENGKYYVYLFSKDEQQQTYFMYVSEKNIESLIPIINGAKSSDEIYEILSSPENYFAYDADKLEKYLSGISAAMYELKSSKTYTDAKTLINDYKTAEAIGQLRMGADADSVIEAYQSYFEIDYSEYKSFNPNIKSEIVSCLINGKYDKKSAPEIYLESKIYSEIKLSSSWDELKKAMEKYGSELSLDKSYFKDVVNSDDVYIEMYKNRSGIKDYDAVKSVFYNASRDVYNSENKPKNNTSSGGGGGGGKTTNKGGNMSVAPEVEQQIKDNDKEKPNLTDISGHWAETYINSLVKSGVVSGFEDYTFRPDIPATRAEFVKLVVSALNLGADADCNFADIQKNSWYFSYISSAFANGLVTGDENGMFRPNEYITREDAAVIIYRALKDKLSKNTDGTFIDFELVSDYAKEAVSVLKADEILNGNENGSFEPDSETTRAQIVAMLYRAVYR